MMKIAICGYDFGENPRVGTIISGLMKHKMVWGRVAKANSFDCESLCNIVGLPRDLVL